MKGMEIRTKVLKIITRAMEDTRGLDDRYPNEEDADDLAEVLNAIADDAVDKIIKTIKDMKNKQL